MTRTIATNPDPAGAQPTFADRLADGNKVDNPEDYKAEPLEGGPSDPDAKS